MLVSYEGVRPSKASGSEFFRFNHRSDLSFITMLTSATAPGSARGNNGNDANEVLGEATCKRKCGSSWEGGGVCRGN